MEYKTEAHIKIVPCRIGDSEINLERRFDLKLLFIRY